MKKASVFPGFCAPHDDAMFKDVDSPNATLDRNFALRLCYRALAKEAHAKQSTIDGADILARGDAGLPLPNQVDYQDRINLFLYGTQLGVKDLVKRKEWLERAIAGDNGVPEFEWQSIALSAPVPVVGTGAYNCETTFAGDQRPIAGPEADVCVLAHALFPVRGAAGCILGWFRDGMHQQCRQFAESLDCLLAERVPTALVRFTIDVSENFFVRPSWYNGLSGEALADIGDRMECGLGEGHSSLCLLDNPAITVAGRGSVVTRSWS